VVASSRTVFFIFCSIREVFFSLSPEWMEFFFLL
jgi:hypothetical protein